MATFTPPPTPAVDLEQAFPKLTSAQIERIRPEGKIRQVKAGEILFEPGSENIPFFVLISGTMEIVQPDMNGERRIATHEAGDFTGEMTMISGRRTLVRGRMTTPGELIEITSDNFRGLVSKDAQLNEILMRAFILRRLLLISHGQGNVILMGSRHSAQTLHLREFLSRNGHPHTYVDLDSDRDSQQLLDRFHVNPGDIPVVVCNGRSVLRNPSIQKLADCLGLDLNLSASQLRDVVIVGAGPAGLAAAVYAASEGLDVLVIEPEAPGGQAGSSSKIENYLGFPMGVSGLELSARAVTQAQKFGAQLMISHKVTRLHCDRHPYEVTLDDGRSIRTRAVIIASGAHYNKPNIENLKKFEGLGIYYGATYIESQLCGNEELIVVGGGNSAGQAAVFLSQTAKRVHILVRSSKLADTMSRYLVQRIEENPAIELHYCTEIVKLEGEVQLDTVTWQDKNTGETSAHKIGHVFIMTGASPRTDWLKGCLVLDDKGFITTGRDSNSRNGAPPWPLDREPLMLETSLPGVFAVGDVRSGNVKRVASAVGEGSIAVHLVHQVLADL